MIVYEFEVTINGLVCAASEEDAISMLLDNPALYGNVEIDSLEVDYDAGDYDYGSLDTDSIDDTDD